MPSCFSHVSPTPPLQWSPVERSDVSPHWARPQPVLQAQAAVPHMDTLHLPPPKEKRAIQRKIGYGPLISSSSTNLIQNSKGVDFSSPSPSVHMEPNSDLSKSPELIELRKEAEQNLILTRPIIHCSKDSQTIREKSKNNTGLMELANPTPTNIISMYHCLIAMLQSLYLTHWK